MSLLGDVISSSKKMVQAAGVEIKSGGSNRPIPVDTKILMRFVEGELRNTRAGDKMIAVKMEVITQPWAGVVYYERFNVGHSNPKVAARALGDWIQYSKSCGLDAEATDFAQLQGLVCVGRVWGHEPSQDGKYMNEQIGDWERPSEEVRKNLPPAPTATSFVDDDIPF